MNRLVSAWGGLTPPVRGLIKRAAVLVGLYAIAGLAGLRQYTTFLSGTSADTTLQPDTVMRLGLLYLLLYFSFILLVPILLIAAALLAGNTAWQARRSKPARSAARPAGEV